MLGFIIFLIVLIVVLFCLILFIFIYRLYFDKYRKIIKLSILLSYLIKENHSINKVFFNYKKNIILISLNKNENISILEINNIIKLVLVKNIKLKEFENWKVKLI